MNWPIVRLGSVVETLVPQRDKPDPLTGPIPWVRIEDFTGRDLSSSRSGQGVTPEQVRGMNLRVFPPGTVLCSCSCSMGATAIATTPLVSNQTFIGLVPRKGIEARFLYYLMRSMREELQSQATGAIQQYLSRDDFRSLRFPLPLLEEQRRIADFLDTQTSVIDGIIARRRLSLELLAERRTATIRARLVQGENHSGRRGASRVPWLTGHPEHWGAAPVRYLAKIQRGASPRPIEDPKYFDDDGTHAWVRISDVSASQKYLKSTTQRLSALGRSLSVALRPGELFVSIAASVGKPIISTIPCCIHDGFVAIRRPKLNTEFLYYCLLLGDAFRGLGKLGTQLNLNSDTIGSIVMPVPPPEEQERIVQELNWSIGGMDVAADLIKRQMAVLGERRQALISAAVTGQIDVTTVRGADV